MLELRRSGGLSTRLMSEHKTWTTLAALGSSVLLHARKKIPFFLLLTFSRFPFHVTFQITNEQEKMINELQAQLKSRNNRIRKWQKDLSNLREDRNKLRRDLDDKGESCFLSAVTHMCLTSWLHDILNFCFCQKRELIRQWKILK